MIRICGDCLRSVEIYLVFYRAMVLVLGTTVIRRSHRLFGLDFGVGLRGLLMNYSLEKTIQYQNVNIPYLDLCVM